MLISQKKRHGSPIESREDQEKGGEVGNNVGNKEDEGMRMKLTEYFGNVRVVHVWTRFQNFPSFISSPNHECIHRPLDVRFPSIRCFFLTDYFCTQHFVCAAEKERGVAMSTIILNKWNEGGEGEEGWNEGRKEWRRTKEVGGGNERKRMF